MHNQINSLNIKELDRALVLIQQVFQWSLNYIIYK